MLCLRHAHDFDLDCVDRLEHLSFSEAEAPCRERLKDRIRVFPEHFWLLFDEGELVAYCGGMAANEPHLKDEMYADPSLHDPAGAWQMLFTVCSHPDLRGMGLARYVLEACADETRIRGKKGIVLTCKEELVPFYERFGYADEGVSPYSRHAGIAWHEMRLTFRQGRFGQAWGK